MKIRSRILLATALAVISLALPAQAFAAIKIHKIYFDSPGSDTGSNSSLNAEYIVIKNTGSSKVDIGNWTIRDVANHVYRFPDGFDIAAGSKVTVHTGSGSSGPHHRYWGQDWYIWNNDGDTARLKKPNSNQADSCTYSGAGSSVFC